MTVAMGTSALQNMAGGMGERDIYDTAITLFTHRHSADMHDRQVATIRRLCKMHKDGFYVADLRHLSRLLELMGTLVAEGKEAFVEPLVEMLNICGIPFIKEIASEEYRNFAPLCDTIANTGKLLVCPDKRVVLAAGEVLARYAGAEDGLPATVSYHHQVLEHSKIARCVSTALREGGGADRQVLLQLLRVVLELSRTQELAAQLLEEDCLPAVIESLLCGFKTEVVLFAVEALWNVFELVPDSVAHVATARTIEVHNLLLSDLLAEGHRTQDKELRNEVLILITYLAGQEACSTDFARTGLLDLLLTTSSAVEADQARSSVKAFNLTSCLEDFEMKRAMINIVCLVSSAEVCLSEIASHPVFLDALLLHLDARLEQHVARSKYSPQQERQLQVQCLETLAVLVPQCGDLFRDREGVQVLVDFLAEESEESLRAASLKTLLATAQLPGYQDELGGRACAMMLSLVKERSLHPFGIRQAALGVLSALCREHAQNQQVVGELEGIDLIVENLEWVVEDATRLEPMALTAVDALWNAVCGNTRNEELLDGAGGLMALLDLLECCPHAMKFLLTSCLANLLENRALLGSVYDWRSRETRRGVVAMLLGLWEGEVVRIEAEDKQYIEVHNQRRQREHEMESAQMVEFVTTGNLHTKLHALLCMLDFEVGDDELSTAEEKQLLTAKHFLDDKDATLWRAFSNELSAEGIRPVTPDHRALEARFRDDEAADEELREQRLMCDEAQQERERTELRVFWRRIHEEEAAKRSTARRISSNLPASTRTKIIVDSHKAQVYPPLLNPKQDAENKLKGESDGGAGAGAEGAGDASKGVDAFLSDAATAKMARSRPNSGRPGSGKGGGKGGLPAGAGMAAAQALRAS